MLKTLLIIKREYLVRVRKKSFLIMTILGPILMASLLIIPIYLTNKGDELRNVAINYKNNLNLNNTEVINFTQLPDIEFQKVKNNIGTSEFYAALEVHNNTYTLYSDQQITKNVIDQIKQQIESIVKIRNLNKAGVDPSIIEKAKTNININTKIIDDNGDIIDSNSDASIGIGFIGGVLIYMFIFMYGTMVMRGVIEEKTNRIVEVIVSSVKPFQLMIGKILGVALVGFTQFFLWVILTICLATVAEITLLDSLKIANESQSTSQSIILSQIATFTGGIDLFKVVFCFLFYFLAGYLLYSSLFAAVGSAVDAEADTQQFVLPITIPLILSFLLIQNIMDNPDGSLAFWMSIIPFTSPVIMMVRLPFGVDSFDLFLSMITLIISFISIAWIASKIYRVGILMYGKKASYKEIWKWIRY